MLSVNNNSVADMEVLKNVMGKSALDKWDTSGPDRGMLRKYAEIEIEKQYVSNEA